VEVGAMADRLTADQLTETFRRASGHEVMPSGWTAVGAWVRVSSGKQDEANQVPSVIGYCVAHKYWPARWYVVHSKSAYHGKHQGDLDLALDDMRHQVTTVLVCWHSDRIERRPAKSLLDLLAEFGDAGGKVESVQEPMLGEMDMGGQVTTFIAGLMNHEKSRHLGEQVAIGHDRVRANNAVISNVPWGFDIVGEKYNKKPVPTDVCRKYAPLIFWKCAAGDSLRTIAAWLDSEGVRPKYYHLHGNKWSESGVRWIIKQRIYAGRWVVGDRTISGRTICTLPKEDRVVNPDLWERANKALKARPKRGRDSGPPNRPMLAKLKCIRCGSPMYRILTGNERRGRYFYYRCSGSGAQRKGCGNMVRFERLENMVAVRMLAWHHEPHQIREWVDGKNWDSEISDVVLSMRELDPSEMDEDEYDAQHDKLKAELKEFKRRNKEEGTKGGWAYTPVLNADGSIMTKGQYFYDLYQPYMDGGDVGPARDYLKTQEISAERIKCCGGVRVIINGREDAVHEISCDHAAEATMEILEIPESCDALVLKP
jgi:DNA invertase Pin-like site-specific DNA recombinase